MLRLCATQKASDGPWFLLKGLDFPAFFDGPDSGDCTEGVTLGPLLLLPRAHGPLSGTGRPLTGPRRPDPTSAAGPRREMAAAGSARPLASRPAGPAHACGSCPQRGAALRGHGGGAAARAAGAP